MYPSGLLSPCPLRIIVIGSPLEPVVDQVLEVSFTVLPKRILLPHLPSYIISPSKGFKGWILESSLKVLPNETLDSLLGVTLDVEPKLACS